MASSCLEGKQLACLRKKCCFSLSEASFTSPKYRIKSWPWQLSLEDMAGMTLLILETKSLFLGDLKGASLFGFGSFSAPAQ